MKYTRESKKKSKIPKENQKSLPPTPRNNEFVFFNYSQTWDLPWSMVDISALEKTNLSFAREYQLQIAS